MPLTPLTLGTAGHVDHGKTALVEALTGTNTDRLAEERERGISIELGYAVLELPSGRRLSVVDVPGHERFVRTMVAGATGVDLFLLVVDAGEGPRAQTFEHLEILRLLGVERGVVAVTKVDAVDPERVEETAATAGELVPGADIVRVSAVTGEGLDELRGALDRTARDRTPNDAPTRLYVDRVFSLPGPGPVATGTLWSGRIEAGDTLDVLPGGFGVRVRSVQVHGAQVDGADAGQRVAVAFTADRRKRVARGDALVAPGAYPVSFRVDVALDGHVPDGARVQVCHGTSAIPARVVRIGPANAQVRLDRPLVAARGDRVVLRRETTVGGGIVLDPSPPRHADARRIGRAVVDAPVRADELRRRGLAADEDGLVQAGAWVCSGEWLSQLRERAHAALAAREGEVDPGLPASALVGSAAWAADVEPLLGLDRVGGKLYLPGRRPSAGARGDAVEVGPGLEPTKVEPGLALQLEREGRLVRLGDGLAISPEAYAKAKDVLVGECERVGSISLARYRDLLGASRRVAQLLLERLDADRVTLRVGDERRLRRSSQRVK
jgi:selenocysteine-specific elongation factor